MSTTHDRIGKHRKHPRGRGDTEGMHHHCILFDKYHLGFFSKSKVVTDSTVVDNAPVVVDITHLGYCMILGKGILIKKLIVVKPKPVS
ncbi:hypothetical protein Hanom_Chr00s011707g01747871 [Helianthus anomalus]